MEKALIKEERYFGKYVAIQDVDKPEVISSGENPQQIYDEALNKGISDPIILFVPEKDLVQIY